MTFWGVHIKTWNTSENLIWNKSEKRHRSIEKFIYTILYVTHTKHWSYTVDVNPAHSSCVSFSALSLRKKARAKCKWLVTNWLARQEKENLFPTVLFAQIHTTSETSENEARGIRYLFGKHTRVWLIGSASKWLSCLKHWWKYTRVNITVHWKFNLLFFRGRGGGTWDPTEM